MKFIKTVLTGAIRLAILGIFVWAVFVGMIGLSDIAHNGVGSLNSYAGIVLGVTVLTGILHTIGDL